LSAFILTLSVASFALDFQSAQVADISDRKYEPALEELIDSAKQSIVMSMYIFKPVTAPVFVQFLLLRTRKLLEKYCIFPAVLYNFSHSKQLVISGYSCFWQS